jgi:hypothetical protein
MPLYRIIASNRYTNTYEVEAPNADIAIGLVYKLDSDDVVEIDCDCVGTDIIECEIVG